METDVIKIIYQYVENSVTVKIESNFIQDLCIDSLKMMQILCEVEDKYKIEIPYSELESVFTVEDFIKCIERNM